MDRDRLTKRYDSVVAYIGEHKTWDENIPAEMSVAAIRDVLDRLAAYEDTGMEPEEIAEYLTATDEYVSASEEGRLIVLPCKVGDTVYEPTNRGTISTYLVRGFRIEPFDSIWLEWDIQTGFVYRNIDGVNADAIGKTAFLSYEEAEAALGGGGDGI